ncbi:MAG TPA: hypothetical protein ENG10_03590 [Candidatus Bathyarchaeota archaeon]|nr:hypothetical protein [Candidatus Bathyarchaeota archaeon]HEX69361.1 hypothetical protein [Candidatus Bathyarchaeota archaeon]
MDVESVIVIISVFCFALAIYMAILSTQTIDAEFKMRLADWAVYCLVGGIVILTCWLIIQMIKRAFYKKEERLTTYQL